MERKCTFHKWRWDTVVTWALAVIFIMRYAQKRAPYEEKYGTFHGEKGPHKKKKRPHKENKGPQKEKRPRNGEQKSTTRRKKGPSHGEKGSLPSCDRPWVIMHLCVQMSNVMQIVDETNNITVHRRVSRNSQEGGPKV